MTLIFGLVVTIGYLGYRVAHRTRCTSGQKCLPTNYIDPAKCAGCTSGQKCLPTNYIDPAKCAGCSGNLECQPKGYIDPAKCAWCSENQECQPKGYIDPANCKCCGVNQKCKSSDEHCTSNGECKPGKPCKNQEDCDASSYCETETNTNIKSCQPAPQGWNCNSSHYCGYSVSGKPGDDKATHFGSTWIPPTSDNPYGSCPTRGAHSTYFGIWNCDEWNKNRNACPKYILNLDKGNKCDGIKDLYKDYKTYPYNTTFSKGLTQDDVDCIVQKGQNNYITGCE